MGAQNIGWKADSTIGVIAAVLALIETLMARFRLLLVPQFLLYATIIGVLNILIMAVLERIRRRPLNVRLQESITMVFAILLISFMFYVTCYDLKRLPLIRKLFNQESQIEQTVKPAPAPANPVP